MDQIQSDIESNDTEVAVKKQALSEAQEARDIARGRLNEAEKKRLEAETNMVILIEKESGIEKQLELKKRALQKLQEKENEAPKNEEIQKLQQELKVVQTKLTLEEETARSFREQFQEASEELDDKSVRVQDLEKEQRKLETQLEIEKMKAGQLLMLATAASKSQHHQEIEVQCRTYFLCSPTILLRGYRLVLCIHVSTTNWLHKQIIKIMLMFQLLGCSLLQESHHEDCSPAVETLAFDDVFVQPVCGWQKSL